MPKTRNPAVRQGLDSKSFPANCNRDTTALTLRDQPEFAPVVEWLAARAGVAVETARLYAEMHRFGGGPLMSGALVHPLTAPLINGTSVRFFKAPLPVPHLPWHALDDLHKSMKLPRSLRKELLRRSRAFPGGEFVTVPTPDGPVVIGSHAMAQGCIGAAIEVHGVPPEFQMQYVKAAIKAMKVLTGDLSPIASFEFSIEAARNTLGVRT